MKSPSSHFPRSVYAAFASLVLLAAFSGLHARSIGNAITFGKALYDAEELLEAFPLWSVYGVSGRSMDPILKDGYLVVSHPVTTEEIDIGMLVIYRDADHDLVVHQVIAIENGIIQTKGYRNMKADPDPVNEHNLIGAVVAVFPVQSELNEPVYLGNGKELATVFGKHR